jgi:peptide/nickel transport system permease protein
VVEVIFSIPGMGRLMYESVVNNDVPAIQASIVCLVGLAVLITTVTDVVYTFVNPTVRAAHVSA